MPQPKVYRMSSDPEEIKGILETAKELNSSILWQIEHGKRLVYNFKLIEIDLPKSQVHIEFMNEPYRLKFHDPCFIKLDIKDSAFKTELVLHTRQKAILSLPSEVVIEELRAEKRYYFRPLDEKNADIEKVQTTLGKETGSKDFRVTILNISEHGVGLMLSGSNQQNFSVGAKIKIVALGDMKIPKLLEGEILFKSSFQRKGIFDNESGFRIGVRLFSKVPKEIFQNFIYVERKIKLEDDRLLHDQDFRSQLNRIIRSTHTHFTNNPFLNSFIESLELKKEGNKYLKNHIELLCQVACGVAKSLDWLSEKTLEKLVYVSFIHDIRYKDHPHLAQIRDKKNFQMQLGHLTPREQMIFLAGPDFAAKVAAHDELFQDDEDIEKILVQQKERPDGTGFPKGIMGVEISALACLFILSHLFVDYMFETSDWTYKEFVRRYKSEYPGLSFQRIFDVFEELS